MSDVIARHRRGRRCGRGDGKTTILANFAAAFAKLNMSVVLVEADMRRPTFHKRFGVPADGGLADVLKGTAQLDDVLIPSGVTNLTLLTAGTGTANPSELLQSEEFDQMMGCIVNTFGSGREFERGGYYGYYYADRNGQRSEKDARAASLNGSRIVETVPPEDSAGVIVHGLGLVFAGKR